MLRGKGGGGAGMKGGGILSKYVYVVVFLYANVL